MPALHWAAFRQLATWPRQAPDTCRICGQAMNTPGDYRAFEGRLLTHWQCWESLPECANCGRGILKLCDECRR